MVIEKQDKISSQKLTQVKYTFSIYEKRILLKVVEMLKDRLSTGKLKSGFDIQENEDKEKIYTIPIASLLMVEKDGHNSRVKQAFRSLFNKGIICADSYIDIKKYERTVRFKIHPNVYKSLLNYSQGFDVQHELIEALSQFRGIYAQRSYDLFANRIKTITYSIEELKTIFQLEDTWNNTSIFIKKVIISSKKELDKSSCQYSFNYTPIKQGGKIIAITFTPISKPRILESSERIENKKNIQEESTLLVTQSVNKQEENVVSNKKPKKSSKPKPKPKSQSSQPITPIKPITDPESKNKGSWVKRVFKRLLGKKNLFK